MKRLNPIVITVASLLILLAGCNSIPAKTTGTYVMPEPTQKVSAIGEETPAAAIGPEKKEVDAEVTPEDKPDNQIVNEEALHPEQASALVSVTPVEKTPTQSTSSPPPVDTKPSSDPPVPPPTTPVEAHTHSYKATVTPPSCEDSGYTQHSCSCGDSYVDSTLDPLGHAYVQTSHVDGTTQLEGYTEYTCSRCNASYREIISKVVETKVSAADAQSVCDAANSYIRIHYKITDNRGTYTGVTWIQTPSHMEGAINSAIGTVDLYAQYYGAKSFYCGYWDSGDGSFTIVMYWDTV